MIIQVFENTDTTLIEESVITIDDEIDPINVIINNEASLGVGVTTIIERGPAGPAGINGSPGGSYTHIQAIASDTWTIVHNLNFFPNVVVIDTLGREVQGEKTYTNSNTLVITFTGAFSGTAYLS